MEERTSETRLTVTECNISPEWIQQRLDECLVAYLLVASNEIVRSIDWRF